jgi:DNA-binding MarR family transcriptional regulator
VGQEDETGGRLIDQIRRNWPSHASISTELVIRLFRLRDLVWSRSNAEAHHSGLTWGEFEALAALRAGGSPFRMTPGEINRLMLVTSGGLTKILQNLDKKALVHRVGNDADGRSCFIELTEPGAALVDELARVMAESSDRLIGSALSTTEQKQLLGALERLTCAAENQD